MSSPKGVSDARLDLASEGLGRPGFPTSLLTVSQSSPPVLPRFWSCLPTRNPYPFTAFQAKDCALGWGRGPIQAAPCSLGWGRGIAYARPPRQPSLEDLSCGTEGRWHVSRVQDEQSGLWLEASLE